MCVGGGVRVGVGVIQSRQHQLLCSGELGPLRSRDGEGGGRRHAGTRLRFVRARVPIRRTGVPRRRLEGTISKKGRLERNFHYIVTFIQ